MFAAGVIESLRAEPDFTDGTTDGDCGQEMANYRWKQTISPAGVEGLHEVEVTVENARSGQAIYELRTLLFQRPEDQPRRPSQPGTRKRQ